MSGTGAEDVNVDPVSVQLITTGLREAVAELKEIGTANLDGTVRCGSQKPGPIQLHHTKISAPLVDRAPLIP